MHATNNKTHDFRNFWHAYRASPTFPNLNVKIYYYSSQQYWSKYLSLLTFTPIFGTQNSFFLKKLEIENFYIGNSNKIIWAQKKKDPLLDVKMQT